MEFKEILNQHCGKYPELALADLIKLAYQNAFGPGHLIKDESESLARLVEEWESVDPRAHEVCDDIGNGLCRLHIAAAKAKGLSPATVNRFFVNTANEHHGSIEGFEEKLAVLLELCADRTLPFDEQALAEMIARYRAEGYPAVSHSAAYRNRYAPAYRVVKRCYCDFLELFCRIDALLGRKPNPVIAIEGNAAAGKTSLAALVQGVYGCNLVHMDHFFLPENKRSAERLSEIGGNVDYERFCDEVIMGLLKGQAFDYRVFDCQTMDFCGSARVDPSRMTIVEGSYSMHPRFGDAYDLRVFLSADPQTQRRRILNRNGPEALRDFVDLWIPKEDAYFRELHIADRCDLVF